MNQGFRITRTRFGTARLSFGRSSLPANERFIDELLARCGILVEPGRSKLVPAELAKEVLEEALANLGHELQSLEAQKRELLRYCLIAEDLVSKAVA